MDVDAIEYEHQELECELNVGLSQPEEIRNQVSGRKRKKTSSVWNHITRVDSENVTCNYCGNNYTASPSLGISHLLRHLKRCTKKPKFENVVNMLIDHEGKLKAKKIDQKIWRKKFAKLIICHELSFAFVEYASFKELILYANPDIKMICRNTASSDVVKLYVDEKDKLKLRLANIHSRICLTSDL
ncbi:PREDICTED: uncharacterized protein LOC109116815 [Tarenaya hassleriana]|uniref:uncharacterized protein LOC109116815 n=1 Tax=Tarenaya hassleriana TaxID=28532 RepID=UPI0008FD7DB5|nr:PREDICTED: uncharacterized protein LOC109116815 [Tarenaya hassleriana]